MSLKYIPRREFTTEFQTDDVQERIAFNAMISDTRWAEAQTFREQCKLIKEYLYNGHVNVSLARLSALFGSLHCVEKQFTKIKRDETSEPCVGRPSLLTDEEIAQVKTKISESHSERHFPTYDEIRLIIEEETEKVLDINQVRGLVYNHTDFKTIRLGNSQLLK